ncbi:MAG: hypothetical protein ABII13_01500 [Patescibacteria group bacterium]
MFSIKADTLCDDTRRVVHAMRLVVPGACNCWKQEALFEGGQNLRSISEVEMIHEAANALISPVWLASVRRSAETFEAGEDTTDNDVDATLSALEVRIYLELVICGTNFNEDPSLLADARQEAKRIDAALAPYRSALFCLENDHYSDAMDILLKPPELVLTFLGHSYKDVLRKLWYQRFQKALLNSDAWWTYRMRVEHAIPEDQLDLALAKLRHG